MSATRAAARVPWSLAARLLIRDWRSGEVLVLLAALTIAVAAMSAVTFFTERVRQAVTQEAGESLAADLRLESTRPLPERYRELAMEAGLEIAEVVHLRSVVLAGGTSSLADVRGVSELYPLRGAVQVADAVAAPPYEIDGVPAQGEVWAEPALLARLDAGVGDAIEVGNLRLRVAKTLEFRPDEGWRFMELAPTLLLDVRDVYDSGLIAPGSIVEYEALYAGTDRALATFRAQLEPLLTAEEELEDIRDARPEVRASAERAERFLVLAALVSVLLGGVGVAMAARRFVARRLDSVALMKCLGARYRDVLRLTVSQLAILVTIAALLGAAIGFAAQLGLTLLLADFIETSLPPASATGGVLGPLTALTVAIGFALPPLLQLGGVPPARVLRQDLAPPPLRYLAIHGAAVAVVGGLLYYLFRDLELLMYVLGGTAATFGALYGAGRVLVLALARLRGGVGIAWRYGIANVARRGRESSVQVVAFGIGLMVLLLLTIVRGELMVEWQATLPENAPNHFLINVQPGEQPTVAGVLARNGLEAPRFTPLVRGRISHVNGTPVSEVEAPTQEGREELRDEVNLTWTAELASDNRIIAGEWWSGTPAEPELSIEESLMEEIGVELGDVITYSLGGRPFSARITSVRSVQWDSFRPNFFMVVSPGAIEQFPHTFITSFYVPPEQRTVTVDLVRSVPSASVIDIVAVLEQVRRAMDRAALAVQYVFSFTVAAGVIVLLAAVQATRDERMFESAVLRALGARRGVVLQGVASEFTALGMLAGALGAIGAGGVGYVIADVLFELTYVPGVGLWLAGIAIGAVVVGVSGTLAVRSVVNQSPLATLRNA